jgi:Transposase zinc-binding domain
MGRSGPEVADVFRRYGDAYREQHGGSMSTAQRRVMTAIEICRTAALGGHVEQCDTCGHQRICWTERLRRVALDRTIGIVDGQVYPVDPAAMRRPVGTSTKGDHYVAIA